MCSDKDAKREEIYKDVGIAHRSTSVATFIVDEWQDVVRRFYGTLETGFADQVSGIQLCWKTKSWKYLNLQQKANCSRHPCYNVEV